MRCPLGHGDLHPETHSGLDVQTCSQCGGSWLFHAEIQALEATAASDSVVLAGMIEYEPHSTDRRCPVCEKAMYEFDYRGNPLEVDACPDGHGYWLDGGEEARVRELILQRARDLHRTASAEVSFGAFVGVLRKQLGGRGRRP
jgi:Zn-finger nucleic acid-binding protein